MNSPVTWFEITSPDAGSLRTFYADTFGWSPQPVGGGIDYATVEPPEGGIGGGIGGVGGHDRSVHPIRTSRDVPVAEQLRTHPREHRIRKADPA